MSNLAIDSSIGQQVNGIRNDYFQELPIDIMVTYRCNLNCKKCYAPKSGYEASFDEITKAVNKLYDGGIRRIVLTGGEPLVREDLPQIAAYIKKKGFEVYLSTNGLLLKERWEEMAPFLSWISISLDGPNEQINRLMTGNNHFQKVLEFLCYYKDLSEKTAKIKLGTVITKKNMNHLVEMARVIFKEQKGYIPDIWRFYQFSDFSNHNDNTGYIDEFSINLPELAQAVTALETNFSDINFSFVTAEERDEAYIFIKPDLDLAYSSKGRYISLGNVKELSPQEVADAIYGVSHIWDKCIANRKMYT
ncbi:MAG TPA: radical SAM protein [Bacillota bacterium]|nr:radical SAM protein [Bacillota bacterium]